MRIIALHGETKPHLRRLISTASVNLPTFRQNKHVAVAQADLTDEFLHLYLVRLSDEFLLG